MHLNIDDLLLSQRMASITCIPHLYHLLLKKYTAWELFLFEIPSFYSTLGSFSSVSLERYPMFWWVIFWIFTLWLAIDRSVLSQLTMALHPEMTTPSLLQWPLLQKGSRSHVWTLISYSPHTKPSTPIRQVTPNPIHKPCPSPVLSLFSTTHLNLWNVDQGSGSEQ